jgi:large subunit ribosomal protein L29
MKQADIKGLSNDDLQEKLLESRDSVAKLRRSHAISPLENPAQIKLAKKTVARILTELKKRELEQLKNTK